MASSWRTIPSRECQELGDSGRPRLTESGGVRLPTRAGVLRVPASTWTTGARGPPSWPPIDRARPGNRPTAERFYWCRIDVGGIEHVYGVCP
jgi:hypothetical protein